MEQINICKQIKGKMRGSEKFYSFVAQLRVPCTKLSRVFKIFDTISQYNMIFSYKCMKICRHVDTVLQIDYFELIASLYVHPQVCKISLLATRIIYLLFLVHCLYSILTLKTKKKAVFSNFY